MSPQSSSDVLPSPARRRILSIAIALLLTAGLGVLDYLTGADYSLALFYLLPIALVTWEAGDWEGLAFATLSMILWIGTDIAAGSVRLGLPSYYWDICIRFSFLLIVTALLSRLRNALATERTLSQTDFLTGAVNSRSFYDLATRELDRLRRYGRPFTFIFLDIDNFKEINDSCGHGTGDDILRTVVKSVRKILRATDIAARLGGDEFAFLLPETEAGEARTVARKIQEWLAAETAGYQRPVTVSLGVLTCREAPVHADELIRLGDQLMYAAKNAGKNSARFGEFPSEFVPVTSRADMVDKNGLPDKTMRMSNQAP